jgi:hypothetical protein
MASQVKMEISSKNLWFMIEIIKIVEKKDVKEVL